MAFISIAGVVLALVAVWRIVAGFGEPAQQLIYYTAKRSDLPIDVLERGDLESQTNTEIVCEVENISYDRGGSSDGTQILFIVPNGKIVEEGELLVELDSSAIRDRIESQALNVQESRNEQIQAELEHEKIKTQNETSLAEAELQIALAQMQLTMYGDVEGGTSQIARQELMLNIQEAKNGIVEAEASLLIQRDNTEGVEALYRLGYRSKGEVSASRLDMLKAEGAQITPKTGSAMPWQISRSWSDTTSKCKKCSSSQTWRRPSDNRKQAQLVGDAELAQALAFLADAEQDMNREEQRLQRYESQLDKCKIYAPHAGMVVYATRQSGGSQAIITEGAIVRERQALLLLPDLTKMQVKAMVHESSLDLVKEGIPATVTIDARVERTYRGVVKSVSVLPDQGGMLSSDVKVYETIVEIDEQVDSLQPGMTAVVEIHAARLQDVISVPVQAIVEVGDDTWCYVHGRNGIERRVLELGDRTTNSWRSARAWR